MLHALYSRILERLAVLGCGPIHSDTHISFKSPFREDKRPSMVLYFNTNVVLDFGSDYKANVFRFLADLEKGSPSEIPYSREDGGERERKPFDWRPLITQEVPDIIYTYLDSRNISREIIGRYNIQSLNYKGVRVVIPLNIGCEARTVEKREPKCLYPPGCRVHEDLFYSRPFSNFGTLVICEGLFDFIPYSIGVRGCLNHRLDGREYISFTTKQAAEP